MATEIKRMRYFNGLILKENEFILDQNYHIRMRHIHNRYLHGYGIVEGFEFALSTQNHQILIQPGMAMDYTSTEEGIEVSREILLSETAVVDFSEGDVENPDAGGNPTPYTGGDVVYVWISYATEMVDVEPEKGGNEPIHYREGAVIGHSKTKPLPPDDRVRIILGKVILKEDPDDPFSIDDNSIREYRKEGDVDLVIIAGESKPKVETEVLALDDGKIKGITPYLDGKFFPGDDTLDGTDKDGIHVVSEYVSFTGDVNIDGRLGFDGGVSVNEIVTTVNAASSTHDTIPTAKAVTAYIAASGVNTNSRLDLLEGKIDQEANANTLVERTTDGTIQIKDAEDDKEAVALGQLRGIGLLGNLDFINEFTGNLNSAIETGIYYCPPLSVPGSDNRPTEEKGLLIVYKENDDNVIQEYYSSVSSKRYTRMLKSLYSWSSWAYIPTQDTMLTHASSADHDGLYLKLTGGTLSGSLVFNGDFTVKNLYEPDADADAARWIDVKNVDDKLGIHKSGTDHDDRYVMLGGDSFVSGQVTFDWENGATLTGIKDPVDELDAVNKGFVELLRNDLDTHSSGTDHDDRYVLLDGNSFIKGQVTLDYENGATLTGIKDPEGSLDAANMSFVEGVRTELSDHKTSSDHDDQYVMLAGGGTLTSGTIKGIPDPTDPGDAANKSFVEGVRTELSDHKSSTDHDDQYVMLAGGGTLTSGTIKGIPDPTNPGDAANKSFVEGVRTELSGHKSSTDHDDQYIVHRDSDFASIDSLTASGVFRVNSGDTGDLPFSVTEASVYVNTASDGSNNITQLLISATEETMLFRRSLDNGGSPQWSPWKTLWTDVREDSLSMDDPWSGVIKYPNGVMVQFGTVQDTASGFPHNISFHETFKSVPHVQLTSLKASLSYTSLPDPDWSAAGFDITEIVAHNVGGANAHEASMEIAISWKAIGMYDESL